MRFSKVFLALTVAAVVLVGASAAEASHFRGGSIVPSVDANGVLTVEATSFWRPTGVGNFGTSIQVNGPGLAANTPAPRIAGPVSDTSDSRFTKVSETYRITLPPGGGTYQLNTVVSCCRVAGIANALESNFQMNAAIFWDGTTANNPIIFNFTAIQPEVIRGTPYSDNLGAVAGNAGTLSYDDALNLNITAQATGLTINPVTGQLEIGAADTATYADNPSGNIGADMAFSGNIHNSDGSFVEFDWLFDGVDGGGVQNLAPDVTNHIINAIVGDIINQTVTGTDNVDIIADLVTLSLLNFGGPGVNNAPTFVAGAPGDPTTGTFNWNSAGSTPGLYTALIQGSDGSVTDVGTIEINLSSPQGPPGVIVPLPGAAWAGLSLLSLLAVGRRVRRRRDD